MTSDIFFAPEIDDNIFEIDLHSTDNIVDALSLLEKELFRSSQKKLSYAKIIHGIGSGSLAKAVHQELDKHPLVKNWKETADGGSCIVIF